MIHFPDTLLKRYTYTKEKVGVYGETVYEYEYVEDILVDFQNESNHEVSHQYGVDLQNLYKIYIDESTVLNDNDKLEDNEGNMYHIVGNIQHYTHFHNYMKAHIVLERNTHDNTRG